MSDLPILYTVEEVADILHIGRSSTYKLVKAGKITSIKLGKSRRIPLPAMQEYVDDLIAQSMEEKVSHSTTM